MADNVKNIEIKAIGIREARAQIEDLNDEFAKTKDAARMQEIADEVSDLTNHIANANYQMELMSHNGGELGQMKVQFSEIGKSIKDLDFNRANAQIKQLSQISFKGLISSVKQLGTTFINLGKALLVNPLFLLAAVIAGVVVALVKLVKHFGLLEDANEKVRDAIQWVIEKFNDLMENKFVRVTLGILTMGMSELALATANVADKAIEQAKAYEELESITKKNEETNEKLIKTQNQKIELMKAEGASAEELRIEREKLAEFERDAAQQAIKDQQRLLAQMEGDIFKSKKEIDEAKEKLRELEEAGKDALHSYNVTIAGINTERVNEEKKTNEEIEKQRKQDYTNWKNNEERKLKEKQEYEKKRLEISREIEDLELSLMEDGLEKEIEFNRIELERKLEDLAKNTEIEEKEKERLENLYREQAKVKNELLLEEENKKAVEARKQLNDLLFNVDATDNDRKVKNLEDNLSRQKEEYQKMFDNNLLSKKEFDSAIEALEIQHIQNLKNIYDEEPTLSGKTNEEIQESYNNKVLLYQEMLENNLLSDEEYYNRVMMLDDELSQKIRQNAEEESQARIDTFNNVSGSISQGISAIGNLMNAMYDNEINQAEGNEKKQEAIRKKQFEANKKLQLVNAAINMAQGIVAATGAGFPMMIPGIALATATGIASIATISSQKYSGGGGGSPSRPSAPNTSSLSNSRQMPNIDFLGSGGNSNEVDASPNINNNVNVQTEVRVSETEITNTQNRVKNLESSASL